MFCVENVEVGGGGVGGVTTAVYQRDNLYIVWIARELLYGTSSHTQHTHNTQIRAIRPSYTYYTCNNI